MKETVAIRIEHKIESDFKYGEGKVFCVTNFPSSGLLCSYCGKSITKKMQNKDPLEDIRDHYDECDRKDMYDMKGSNEDN